MQFNRLTHQEGFPARNILAMHQDSKGFLWMAAPDRLIRFDGKRQKLFRYSSSNEKSIGSNTIRFIYEDKSGVLWFATAGGGLNKYNSSQENFIRYTHNRNDLNSISSDDVSSICEDSYGNLWVGTIGGGLNKFDRKTEKFIAYKNDPSNIQSLSNNNVSVICLDSRNNLWVGTTGGGLNIFDIASKKFVHFIHNTSNPNSLSNNNVTGIVEDANGSLWVSTMGGGLNNLTFLSDYQNLVFIHYKNNHNDQYSISSNDISTLYLDREKILWIGTWGGGLNKMIQHPNDNSLVGFISYKHDPLDIFSLIDDNVNC
ncbi:MAG TPA: two-component regulator propeller domain-containing protein, partial [Ignavibacteriaceae bacterium]